MQTPDRIPAQGDPSTLARRLADYVEPVDSRWRSRIAPAEERDIEEYLRVSGLADRGSRLPQSLSSFWRIMGRSDGNLLWWLRATTSVQRLVKYYRDIARSEPETLNPDAPVIALFLLSDQLSLDLRTTAAGEPAVWATSSGEFTTSFADSFEALVFRLAFMRCEYLRFPSHAAYSASPNAMRSALPGRNTDEVRSLALQRIRQAGFDSCWFSDRLRFFGSKPDASIKFELLPDEGPLITIYSKDTRVRDTWLAPLALELGATPVAVANMPD